MIDERTLDALCQELAKGLSCVMYLRALHVRTAGDPAKERELEKLCVKATHGLGTIMAKVAQKIVEAST